MVCDFITCVKKKRIGTHRLTSLSLLALGSLCALRLETLGWCVLWETYKVLHAKHGAPAFSVNKRDLQDRRGNRSSCHPKMERGRKRR